MGDYYVGQHEITPFVESIEEYYTPTDMQQYEAQACEGRRYEELLEKKKQGKKLWNRCGIFARSI